MELDSNGQARQNGVSGVDTYPGNSQAVDVFEGNLNDSELDFQNIYALQAVKEYLGDFPLSNLRPKYISKLGKLLDMEQSVFGGDYIDLASRLFPEKASDALKNELRNKKYPTTYLLEKFKQEREPATVYRLVEALYGMKRLDAVEEVLKSAEKQKAKLDPRERRIGPRRKEMLTGLKRSLIKDQDTISGFSVQSSLSTASYDSLASIQSAENAWSMTVSSGLQLPAKQNYQANNNSWFSRKSAKKKSPDVVLVVAAPDEMSLCVKVVEWLRMKGFNAQFFETGKLEYLSHPSKYVSELIQQAKNMIIVCSPDYEKIVTDGGNSNDNQYLAIKTVQRVMEQDFFESCGHCAKYIPLMRPETPHSLVCLPLRWTMAAVFDPGNKERMDALCRRLCGEEKYKLGPIGSKPIIKPRVITGRVSGKYSFERTLTHLET